MRQGRQVAGWAVCIVLALAAAGESASGEEASGTTVAVVQSASAAGTASGSRLLYADGPVFMGDRVQTGAVGEVQIKFRDQTRMVVGPNSKLLIDAFVFDPSGQTAQRVSMTAVKGAFRFITGASRKQAYSIRTPTVTVGIRGTQFDFSILPSGETAFALYEGEARICDRSHHCVELSGSCSVAVSPPKHQVSRVSSHETRLALLRTRFPYLDAQAQLHRDFKVDTSSCGTTQASIQFEGPTIESRSAPAAAAAPAGAAAAAPAASPAAPAAGPAAPAASPAVVGPGNPGNGKGVGSAGESPGGGSFGAGAHGKSDVAQGNGNGNGNSNR